MKHSKQMLFKTLINVLLGACLTLFGSYSYSNVNPTATINNQPITIDADNQQIDIKKDTLTFTGNVIIKQDTLKVDADTVVISEMQSKDKQIITAKGKGKPVYFEQLIDDDPAKMIKGNAQQLVYDVKNNLVILTGNAKLTRQDNHISSEKITYDVEKQKILAQSGKNSRVKTTIIPNQVKEIKK